MNDKLKPSEKQLRFMDWEMGAFFHFGIRTFYPGHTDWDGQIMDPRAFAPDALDIDSWLSTVKTAGCQYAILTCKHHDGFCLWQTKTTENSVRNAAYQNGKGDIVRQFTDACRRHGLRVGLYASPAQADMDFSNGGYDDFFILQLNELLTNYGKIDYLWLDGCGTEGKPFDTAKIARAIRTAAPDILVFNLWDPDTRWCGNEDGYAPLDNFNETSALPLSMRTLDLSQLSDCRFLPAECDMKLRDTWFDDDNADTVKTPEELLGIWEMSVGRGANLLMNVGPDRHGHLPKPDVQSLLAFAALRHEKWDTPLGTFGTPEKTGDNTYIVSAQEPQLITGLQLAEHLRDGQFIKEVAVYASMPGIPDKELLLVRASTVGHKLLLNFPLMRTARLRIEVFPTGQLTEVKCFCQK